jgi:hypothetical protein
MPKNTHTLADLNMIMIDCKSKETINFTMDEIFEGHFNQKVEKAIFINKEILEVCDLIKGMNNPPRLTKALTD